MKMKKNCYSQPSWPRVNPKVAPVGQHKEYIRLIIIDELIKSEYNHSQLH